MKNLGAMFTSRFKSKFSKLISVLRTVTRPIRYADWLGPLYTLNRKRLNNSEIECLVLVECFDRPGGHFLWWLVWFCNEFADRFQKIVILVVDPAKTLSFLASEGIVLPENAAVSPFIRKGNKTLCLTGIIRASSLPSYGTAVFFMWGDDLIRFSLMRERAVPWGVLGSVSSLFRGHLCSSDEAKVREVIDQSSYCRLFVQPDQYINKKIPMSVWVPDVENIALPLVQPVEIVEIKQFIGNARSVGSFGRLKGERCVTKMIALSKVYPEIKFVLSGELVKDNISQSDLDFIREGGNENFLLIDRYIESEEKFNTLVATVGAIFIDGSNYPLQSGVVMKAMHFGKFVLTTRGNSWTEDLVEEHKVGHVLNENLEGLEDHWERWSLDGGPEGNKAVAEMLTAPSLVRQQFDQMANFLKGRSNRSVGF